MDEAMEKIDSIVVCLGRATPKQLRGVAGINRLYQESGYGISDPATWDTDASKNQADVPAQSSQSSPLYKDLFYGGPWTSSVYTKGQLLSKETRDTEEEDDNTTTTETPLAVNKEMESSTMEAESESFGGELEEENTKRRALNKPDDGTEDCTDQNGSKKKQKD